MASDIAPMPEIIQVRDGLACCHLNLVVTDLASEHAMEAVWQHFGFHQEVIEVRQGEAMAVNDLIEPDPHARKRRLMRG